MNLVYLLIIFFVFLISALPLHLAVKFLGGRTTIIKTAFINILAAILVLVITSFFNVWGSIISFIAVAILYRESFKLKWWKAFLVWLFEGIFLVLLTILSVLIFGTAFLAGLGISTLI